MAPEKLRYQKEKFVFQASFLRDEMLVFWGSKWLSHQFHLKPCHVFQACQFDKWTLTLNKGKKISKTCFQKHHLDLLDRSLLFFGVYIQTPFQEVHSLKLT